MPFVLGYIENHTRQIAICELKPNVRWPLVPPFGLEGYQLLRTSGAEPMDIQKDELLDSIDALGPRPERHFAFTSELLAEAEDEVLQSIVEEAARDLSAPIALVNLVLEEIQFFKAHYGLPSDLAAARGTERDVSFCQFVVRDGEPFEVINAEQDSRVPQHLVKHFGIKSYLGIPVVANDVIVGSLCVIDTQPRGFSEEQRQILKNLADRVNGRLATLSKRHEGLASSLEVRAAAPALVELREALIPIQAGAAAGRLATSAFASFLRLMEHSASGAYTPPEHLKRTLKAAYDALDNCENSFYDIQASAGDAEDARMALEHILTQSASTRLSEVAISGRELARQNVTPVGGAFLPDLSYDPVIVTPRPQGVALVANCLSMVAARMANLGLSGGIRMEVQHLGSQAEIAIKADKLPAEALQAIAAKLSLHTAEIPSAAVEATDEAIQFLFAVVQEES